MKTIWPSFPAISLDWIDEWLDCLVFQQWARFADDIAFGGQVIYVKMIWNLFRKDLLQGSFKSSACGRNVASQIKWLSCMFTSIFGDISMTIQAETLLKGEGCRCPFTLERAGVIHQPGCRPSSTAAPAALMPSPSTQPAYCNSLRPHPLTRLSVSIANIESIYHSRLFTLLWFTGARQDSLHKKIQIIFLWGNNTK